MSDPNEQGAGVSATIKLPESARYKSDNPWIVFHGSVQRIREDISAAFDLTLEGEPTLFDLVVQAQSIASGGTVAARTLGATSAPASSDGEIDPTDPWTQAEKSKPEPELSESDKLKIRVNEATTVPELHDLYKTNVAVFQAEPELLAAWQAKGAAIQAAAA